MQQVRCYLLGERAVVLELMPPFSLDGQQRIWGLVQRLQGYDNVVDIMPGMNNVTLVLDEPQQTASGAEAWLLQEWQKSEAQPLLERLVDVPVIYGGSHGPDLAEVARQCEMSLSQVVELHSSSEYRVCFMGFQPGFPYLAGLDPRLHTPRRAEPRLQVAAGSVGIGGAQTGVYPLATPGGWQLIGRTPMRFFTPELTPPVLLRAGDRIRFVPQREGVC